MSSLYEFFTPVSILYDEEPEFFKPHHLMPDQIETPTSSSVDTKGSEERVGAENIVGFLDEALIRRYKESPRYEIINLGGNHHNPIFKIECSAVGYRGAGEGPNKRVAKMHAAREVLRKVVDVDDQKNFWIPGSCKEESLDFIEKLFAKSLTMTVARITVSDNFVGVLQELCVKYKISVPLYDYDELDLGKEKIFKVTCKVKGFEVSAENRTKKKAKNEAAKQMYDTMSQTIKEMDADLDLKGNDNGSDEEEESVQQQAPDDSSLELLEKLLRELSNQYLINSEYKITPSSNSKTVLLKISIRSNGQDMGRNYAFCGYGETEELAKIMAASRALPVLNDYGEAKKISLC